MNSEHFTPEDEKMWNSRPRLFIKRTGEGACSTFPLGIFTVKGRRAEKRRAFRLWHSFSSQAPLWEPFWKPRSAWLRQGKAAGNARLACLN
jgi:hypothetical protein